MPSLHCSIYTDSQQLLDMNRQPLLSDTTEICWSTHIPEKTPLPFPPLPSFREHIHHVVVSVALRTNHLKLLRCKDKLKTKGFGNFSVMISFGLGRHSFLGKSLTRWGSVPRTQAWKLWSEPFVSLPRERGIPV